ncbi:MAG: HindIII family type II restriction endonuclease [Acidobacteria bacterium]|nr:HindIII family type II restriction endonuclease [Acidobacteriota bacterium]
MKKVITAKELKLRQYWVKEIQKLSGNFGDDFERLESELVAELKRSGVGVLISHLRLCGDIPESYGHDSSEEKLYSKYTDTLLSLAYKSLGMKSLVLKERADAADVEAFAGKFSFVADAKCFRLSRTAKNQKDFKISAMDGWKRGKPYAMVVCPIYQLPRATSQIYEQAVRRNVCIFTYSHLVLLLNYFIVDGTAKAEMLLQKIFQTVAALNPTKSSLDYWLSVNRAILSFSPKIEALWMIEKQAASESVEVAKAEGLLFLAAERERIMRMTHDEALMALLEVHRIENRIKIIRSVSDSGLFSLK